ncbi:MAG: family hydrolase [Pseudonocardiales bacterium]|nr:family hydrolase [Pseudonocardiales bacterium]
MSRLQPDLGRIRLIGSDLDGTLLSHDEVISEGNLAALRRAQDAGVPVVFATGRPPRWMAEVARQTRHTGLAVCANGALLYDLGTEQVVGANLISVQTLREVADALLAEFGEVRFALEHHAGFDHEDGYRHDYDIGPTAVAIRTRDDVLSTPGIKLLVRHHGLTSDEFLIRAQALLGGAVTVTSSSSAGLLEIAAPGVSKATGLASVAESMGIAAHEVAAVGDMPNDLPMLAWAGQSFAVANAHADVLAAADAHVASNVDDGFAQVVDRVLAHNSSLN